MVIETKIINVMDLFVIMAVSSSHLQILWKVYSFFRCPCHL